MRSTLLFLFGLLFMGILAACSPTSREKSFRVGISQSSMRDVWRASMVRDMRLEAQSFPGMTLEVADAGQDNARQSEQIRAFIREGVDLLIISANERDLVTPAAVEAYRAGIPTIILDWKINSDEYTTFIGADNYEIGRSIGRYVGGSLGHPAKVLEVWGRRGSSSAIERHRGFADALAAVPDVRLLEVEGDWFRIEAREAVMRLDSIEDIDVVFAHNDMMALGAREAFERRAPQALPHVRFVGINGLLGEGLGVESVVRGKLDASFYYPTGGGTAIKVAWQILTGQPYKRRYALGTALLDKSNAETLYLQSERLLDYEGQIERQRATLAKLHEHFNVLYVSLIVILVLALALGGLTFYVSRVNRKVRQKNRMLRERALQVQRQKEELTVANQRIEQVTAQKLRFFTNVSHEVKTPLTLILGPLRKMEQDAPVGAFADDIRIIRKNAERLRRVIDQMLDFRKIESNKMGLRVSKVDMVFFVEEVKSYFDNLAHDKRIDYAFRHDMASLPLWIDTDKMEKALANLLSNAFKFTPDGGCVTITLSEDEREALLSVEDNGKGIPSEHLSAVFDRFFTTGHAQGTGIGLHLTREFAQMHKGSIEVESEPGVRTRFTLRLPKGKGHFDAGTVFAPEVTELSCGVAHLDTAGLRERLERRYDYTLLVVEDDGDIRSYLEGELSRNFRVLTAADGEGALAILLAEPVSLVLSDVLMPGMNGFELCRRIKTDMALSHIPVILLTALSDDSQRLYGFDGGADEYIQKPFEIDFVRLRVINLLEERSRLRESLLKEAQSPARPESMAALERVESMDDLFMRKFVELIKANFSDPDFNIERGSESLRLSRVHLYRKVKALSGMTPTDFLRDYRLKRGADLLRQHTATVSEVAYAVGFSSPTYFSRCFKALYGISPTEYVEHPAE